MEHCLTMYLVVKFCISEVRLSKHWNGSTTASTWWITADKSLLYFWREWNLSLAIYSSAQNDSAAMDKSKNSIQMGYQCKTLLYAVCLSLSTFSSVAHFRCRLHFWVQTLKGERFSGWILSVGGRLSPKRLAARPFNFQGLMYYLCRRAKERGEWQNRETHNITDWW